MRSLVALLVTTVGIIVAICAAAQLPAEGERFPRSTPVSLAALAVASAGMAAWRWAERKESRSAASEGTQTDPLELVRQIGEPVQQLVIDSPELDGERLRARVDAILDRYVLPFTAARQTVVQRLGVREGADLIIGFALGERLLNRTWSAAADGHLPEACASLRQAEAAFRALGALR